MSDLFTYTPRRLNMVRIIEVVTSFLALAIATEACAGWYQCKYSDGSHCCVCKNGLLIVHV